MTAPTPGFEAPSNFRVAPRFPIAVAARLTGISAHVLRSWERRVGAVRPARTPSGRRLYAVDDLRRLELLALLTAGDHRIADLAPLSDAELADLAAADLGARATARSRAASDLVATCFAMVRVMDVRALAAELGRGRHGRTTVDFATEVLEPLMTRVGEDWAAGLLTPAHEHIASAVMRRLLGDDLKALQLLTAGPLAIAATPPDDRHEMGAMSAAAAAAGAGWRILYMGPGVPLPDLAQAARTSGASAVLLSVTLRDDVLAALLSLRDALPSSTACVVGGQGVRPQRELLARYRIRVLELSELGPALREVD